MLHLQNTEHKQDKLQRVIIVERVRIWSIRQYFQAKGSQFSAVKGSNSLLAVDTLCFIEQNVLNKL